MQSTLPTSPPYDLKCSSTSENHIQFSWKKPLKIYKGLTVDNYSFHLEINGAKGKSN